MRVVLPEKSPPRLEKGAPRESPQPHEGQGVEEMAPGQRSIQVLYPTLHGHEATDRTERGVSQKSDGFSDTFNGFSCPVGGGQFGELLGDLGQGWNEIVTQFPLQAAKGRFQIEQSVLVLGRLLRLLRRKNRPQALGVGQQFSNAGRPALHQGNEPRGAAA